MQKRGKLLDLPLITSTEKGGLVSIFFGWVPGKEGVGRGGRKRGGRKSTPIFWGGGGGGGQNYAHEPI